MSKYNKGVKYLLCAIDILACGPFTKNKERIEKFMQTGNKDFIYKNELDKTCFQLEVVLVMNQIISWQMNVIDRLLENSKEEKFIHRLETIFGVLI